MVEGKEEEAIVRSDIERGSVLYILGEGTGVPELADFCIALCGMTVLDADAVAYDDDAPQQATCSGCVVKFIVAESEARETE